MNIQKTFLSIGTLLAAVCIICSSPVAQAAIVPTVSLSSVGSSTVHLSVQGDPNSSIVLHVDSAVTTLGTTDSAGNYSAVVGIDSYGIACGKIGYVVVDGQQSATVSWAPNSGVCNNNTIQPSSSTLSFSQNYVQMTVGQTIGVSINGSGGYTISRNPNPSSVSAIISGNVITVSALYFGGSNITVCQTDGQCATLNVVATGSGTSQLSSTLKPSIVSISIASNNANGQFMGAGNLLSISFNTNETASSVSATIAGSPIGVSTSDNNTYLIQYRITGTESLPIPLSIAFTDPGGATGQQSLSIGASIGGTTATTQTTATGTTMPVGCTSTTIYSTVNGLPCETGIITTPTTTPAPVITPTTSTTLPPSATAPTYKFTSFLSLNATGNEVTQLQKKLKTLGYYSGPITGTFGPLTETAVKALQKAHGLNQAGYVGPGTRTVLNK